MLHFSILASFSSYLLKHDLEKGAGQLISFRAARKLPDYHAAVYGFPLGGQKLSECLERLKSLPQSDPEEQRLIECAPFPVMFRHLEVICRAVWPQNEATIMVVFPGGMLVMALVACTRPNDEFIPKQENLQKVADVLAQEGFADIPGWFWVRE